MHMWLTIQGLLTILKTTYKAMVTNAGNRDQLTRQYCMETYLPNSIKKASPSVAKTDETNIFKGCSVELTKKDDKWDFSDKDG